MNGLLLKFLLLRTSTAFLFELVDVVESVVPEKVFQQYLTQKRTERSSLIQIQKSRFTGNDLKVTLGPDVGGQRCPGSVCIYCAVTVS